MVSGRWSMSVLLNTWLVWFGHVEYAKVMFVRIM